MSDPAPATNETWHHPCHVAAAAGALLGAQVGSLAVTPGRCNRGNRKVPNPRWAMRTCSRAKMMKRSQMEVSSRFFTCCSSEPPSCAATHHRCKQLWLAVGWSWELDAKLLAWLFAQRPWKARTVSTLSHRRCDVGHSFDARAAGKPLKTQGGTLREDLVMCLHSPTGQAGSCSPPGGSLGCR